MIVSLTAVLIIVGVLNYLVARHPFRSKWSQHHHFDLSPATLSILGELTNQVEVIVYANRDKTTALHTSIDLLLKEYAYRSPRIHIRHIDYIRDRRAAREISQTYGLADRSPSDLVVFTSGKRHRIVPYQELSDYRIGEQVNDLLQGRREVKRIGFKGELLFTSAIVNIAAGESLKVAYLVGHGEHDLESEGPQGYTEFRQALEEKNFEVVPHHLVRDGPLPEKTRLLVIAGPRHSLLQKEIEAVDRFLQTGGRLLILFNANGLQRATGLEEWLRRWGVAVGQNIVNDSSQRMGNDLAVTEFSDHPTTTPLVDAKVGLLMLFPRSVDPLPTHVLERDLTSRGIAYTSTNGVAQLGLSTAPFQFRRVRDRQGAIPLLTAVEVKASGAENPPAPDTRLLVAGDSFFLSNERIQQYGNRRFASLAAGWLMDQFWLIQGIGPQPLYEFQLTIPDREFQRLLWLMLVAFPAGVLAFGLAVWWRRRT